MRRCLGPVAAGLTISICTPALAAGTVGLTARASRATAHVTARVAKTISLVETAQLKLAHESGSDLLEYGHATGTYNAPVVATLTIHPTYVTAVVTIFPRGGSVTGSARANYVVKNSTGYYGGSFTIIHGTGTFKHASGNALGISGTIDRYTFAVTVKAHGQVHL
jgi:hypothetical protein